MRVYIELPDSLLPTLQDQARAAHRPPRYHLEWLLEQVLQAHAVDAPQGVPVPITLPPPHIERQRTARCELVGATKEAST
jgi:hypothetical protein